MYLYGRRSDGIWQAAEFNGGDILSLAGRGSRRGGEELTVGKCLAGKGVLTGGSKGWQCGEFQPAAVFDDGKSSVLIGVMSRARRRGGKWGNTLGGQLSGPWAPFYMAGAKGGSRSGSESSPMSALRWQPLLGRCSVGGTGRGRDGVKEARGVRQWD
jgi:hypothetical protein